VKASRLSDARGVMLVLPNRDVWTFEALDDKVELEDSVFLAGNDGPRRTAQIVIRQDSRHASSRPLELCALDDLGRRARAGQGATRAASRNCRCRSHVASRRWRSLPRRFRAAKRGKNRCPTHPGALLRDDITPRHPRSAVRFRQDRLIEFARALAGHGVELVSTGGTAKAIADAGLKVTTSRSSPAFPR
jgi:hypothetical protein